MNQENELNKKNFDVIALVLLVIILTVVSAVFLLRTQNRTTDIEEASSIERQ